LGKKHFENVSKPSPVRQYRAGKRPPAPASMSATDLNLRASPANSVDNNMNGGGGRSTSTSVIPTAANSVGTNSPVAVNGAHAGHGGSATGMMAHSSQSTTPTPGERLLRTGKKIAFNVPASVDHINSLPPPKSAGRRHADPMTTGSNLSSLIQPMTKRFSLNRLHRKKSLEAHRAAFEKQARPKSHGFVAPPQEPRLNSTETRYQSPHVKQRRHHFPMSAIASSTPAAVSTTTHNGGSALKRLVVAPWDK